MSFLKKIFGGSGRKQAAIAAAQQAQLKKQRDMMRRQEEDMAQLQLKGAQSRRSRISALSNVGGGALLSPERQSQQGGLTATLGTGNRL